jgi:hypothetical protein
MIPGICNALANGARLYEATGGCATLTVSRPVCEPVAADAGAFDANAAPEAEAGTGEDAQIDAYADATLGQDATVAADTGTPTPGLSGSGTSSDPYLHNPPLADCLAYRLAYGGAAPDGYYEISPQGAAFANLCSMSSDNGGWSLLTSQYLSTLGASPRSYLYLLNGDWYESPVTSLVWDWNTGQPLAGTWSYSGADSGGTFSCPVSLEQPLVGIGCSNGIGATPKCMPVNATAGCPQPCMAPDPTSATAYVCQDVPNAFGTVVCPGGVQVFERAVSADAGAEHAGYDAGVPFVCPCGDGGCTETNRCLQTIASGRNDPLGIFVSGTQVYWAEGSGPGGIFKTDLAGDGGIELVADSGVTIQLYGDDSHIYWQSFGTPGYVYQTDRWDGGTMPLGTLEAGVGSYNGTLFGIDSQFVYYGDPSAGNVMKAPIGGGAAIALVNGQTGPHAGAVDANNVYWFNSSGELRSFPKAPDAGATVTTYASGQSILCPPVATPSALFWPTGSQIDTMPLASPYAISPVISVNPVCGLWIDGTAVYYTDSANPTGRVSKVSIDGGNPVDFDLNQRNPDNVTTDSNSVYWTEYATPGNVMRAIPK